MCHIYTLLHVIYIYVYFITLRLFANLCHIYAYVSKEYRFFKIPGFWTGMDSWAVWCHIEGSEWEEKRRERRRDLIMYPDSSEFYNLSLIENWPGLGGGGPTLPPFLLLPPGSLPLSLSRKLIMRSQPHTIYENSFQGKEGRWGRGCEGWWGAPFGMEKAIRFKNTTNFIALSPPESSDLTFVCLETSYTTSLTLNVGIWSTVSSSSWWVTNLITNFGATT